MRYGVLAAVFVLALPAGGLAAVEEGVVLHLAGRTPVIAPDNLPAPDVPTKTYTVRGPHESHKATHAGISLAKLFSSQGANLGDYKFVQVRRPDKSYAYVTAADGAIVWRGGDNAMHFLRPVRDKKDENAADVFKIEEGDPLVMTGKTGNLLIVTLKAGKTQAAPKEAIDFSATVTGQKKNEKLTYTWRFGDGGMGDASSVTHAYDGEGRYNVFVSVTGSDDSAGSSDAVRVTVGKPPTGTTGGSGSTGGGNSTTQSPPPIVNNPPQTPAPAPLNSIPKTEGTPGATQISGILLASSRPVAGGSLLSPGSPRLASTGSTPNRELPLAGAAVVLLLGLGAFLEGGGRIRIPKLWPR
jgi:PKD domain